MPKVKKVQVSSETAVEDIITYLENEAKIPTQEQQQETKTPDYCSPEWQGYVMSLFTKDELTDGHPNITGLRRVSELLLGPIEFSGPTEVHAGKDPNGPDRATVVYQVIFNWTVGGYQGLMRTFRAVGSSWHGNTDDTFAVFSEAIAETRAEARALRKALRLSSPAADELTKKDGKAIIQEYISKQESTSSGEWDESGPITDPQIIAITQLCKRLNIDINKFINSGSKKYNDIYEVSKLTATKMIQRLNDYQNNSESSVPVPSTITIAET